ncbi:MAG: MaoC family dehydratase N-terminal domain-containing protein [Dehalococcoidia bacterium]
MLSEKTLKLIGKSGEVKMLEVEKGAIKKYADAVGETNLLYWDNEYAENSRYGAMIAPPGFFGWPTRWHGAMPFHEELQVDLISALGADGYTRILDGGIAFEFFRPVRAGDTLASLTRIVSVVEKETKGGSMSVSQIEASYTNQNGDMVAKATKTMIIR